MRSGTSLLLELEPKIAVGALCDYMPRENGTLVRWAIGRALRRADQPDLIRENIQKMLRSSDVAQRQAAAELCGWQEDALYKEWLCDLLSGEMDDKVREVALDALQRQRFEREIPLLMDAFKSADTPHQWSYLEAILELADPSLLGDRRDPTWLGHILDDAPMSLVKHAENRHKKRLEEVQKKAQERDKRIEQSS